MKDDAEYGQAVSRFRLGKCVQADVDLFNSRVVRSQLHSKGVDMSDPRNIGTKAIVRTNFVRQAINMSKAKLHCQAMKQELVMCSARDLVDGTPITDSTLRSKLLRMDVSSDGAAA
jgi:hypothetical protein